MGVTHPRHAVRTPLATRIAVPIGLAVTALASLWALCSDLAVEPVTLPAPVAAMGIPGVALDQTPAEDPCADPAVGTALAAGDDEAAVAAFGGGERFRAAVVAGNAPCISLDDPNRSWVVVNKLRPLQPIDHVPAELALSGLATTSRSVDMLPAAADALARMGADAEAAGAGRIGVNNAYRSYGLQRGNYSAFVQSEGQEGADAGSARPGHSEHQTGLAVDVVACDGVCGGMAAFGGTAQGAWVAENGWRYGFIVRYEHGATETTGYMPEPWHLRYIGPQLAAAYHEGGFHTLEDFFGLPAAPDYGH